jgi:hypothetical protein
VVNPDVFITIAFAGIAVVTALVSLALVVPQVRRDGLYARMRESSGAADSPVPILRGSTEQTDGGAAVH